MYHCPKHNLTFKKDYCTFCACLRKIDQLKKELDYQERQRICQGLESFPDLIWDNNAAYSALNTEGD